MEMERGWIFKIYKQFCSRELLYDIYIAPINAYSRIKLRKCRLI